MIFDTVDKSAKVTACPNNLAGLKEFRTKLQHIFTWYNTPCFPRRRNSASPPPSFPKFGNVKLPIFGNCRAIFPIFTPSSPQNVVKTPQVRPNFVGDLPQVRPNFVGK